MTISWISRESFIHSHFQVQSTLRAAGVHTERQSTGRRREHETGIVFYSHFNKRIKKNGPEYTNHDV